MKVKAVSMARKMVGKKTTVVQLQTEVNTDEDWDKLLTKEGLVVVDVYSGWCGPCVAMVGQLKKIKLAVGGDMLHLAVAKADEVEALKRFRDKSEPTWMFIGSGHLVNLMFGANAPRLTRLISEELAKETAALKGERERDSLPFDQLTPEEQVRFEAAEKIRLAELAEKEAAIAAANAIAHQKLVDKLIQEVGEFTVVVYLPFTYNAQEKMWMSHLNVMQALIPLGINIKEETLREMDYLAAWKIMHGDKREVTDEWKQTLEKRTYNLKLVERTPRDPVGEPDPEDEGESEKPSVIHQTVVELYGCPPAEDGALQEILPDSISMQDAVNGIPGLWTPSTLLDKVEAIIALFPDFAEQFVEPEPEVLPPHLALVFRAAVLDEMEELLPEYEKEVLKLGVYNVDVEANKVTLIGRTPQDYFSIKYKTGKERLVLLVDNTDHDAQLTLSQFEPVYVSPDEEVGEADGKLLFQDPVIGEDGTIQPFEDIPEEMIVNLEGPPPEIDEDEAAAMQAAAASQQQGN